MAKVKLQEALDFILNGANEAEFEVLVVACNKRKEDKKKFSAFGMESPGTMARRLSQEMQKNMGATMENVSNQVTNMITEIVKQRSPDISDKKLAEIIEQSLNSSNSKNIAANKIPSEAIYSMIKSFITYSNGEMAPSELRMLWESDPQWQETYWKSFSGEVRALIKAYIDGKIDEEKFYKAILSVLGI